jgi:demethylmenaquinone methyltransferase/2-methoxy-6-polyprenyl-1,4-benzoquinol methylase
MARTASSTLPAYARDASSYDTQTGAFERYRREIVDELPLRRGDVVIDAGCGTGLCFPALQQRIGPEGTIIGVDSAPEMLAVAADRVAAAGWSNVVLIDGPVEEADLPDQVDHALFCAVHDLMQSGPALDNVLGRVRPGGGVAAGGGKWGPAWAIGLNAGVLALHAPYVRDFTGFDRPWTQLASRVPGLRVREVAMGAGYLPSGRRR